MRSGWLCILLRHVGCCRGQLQLVRRCAYGVDVSRRMPPPFMHILRAAGAPRLGGRIPTWPFAFSSLRWYVLAGCEHRISLHELLHLGTGVLSRSRRISLAAVGVPLCVRIGWGVPR